MARASSNARHVRSNPATLASSCAFSFRRAWARALSFQKLGSSERRTISSARTRLRSTSKRPPECVEAPLDPGEKLGRR
jgi:hypothetical protein